MSHPHTCVGAVASYSEITLRSEDCLKRQPIRPLANFLTRGYTKADELLKEAQMKVQTTQTAATENKEKVKHEVETQTTETEAAIQAANVALLKARGKDTNAELEAMKADLDTTTTALAEARDMYSKGNYLGAKTSLTGSKQTVEKVAAEVELAMQKVKGTKRPSPAR